MASSRRFRSKPYLLFSTTASQKEAQKIAQLLVKKRLAACVNIVPNVVSFFRWKGNIDRAKEFLLVIKTDTRRLKQLERTLVQAHSYSVPELIGMPIVRGHKPYLEWLSEAVVG